MIESPLSFDTIFSNDLRLFQRRRGYRFSVDVLLLAWFVSKIERKISKLALDLGAGNGVVSLLLAYRNLAERIMCVERHEGLFDLLKRNIAVNGFSDRLIPIHGDLRHLKLPRERYDLVVFNPPYYPSRSKHPTLQGERSVARHEMFGDLRDFLLCGAISLKKRGALYFVHPAARIAYACTAISATGLALSHLTLVQERPENVPSLCLYHCRRGTAEATETVIETVTMRDGEGSLTMTAQEILHASSSQKRREGI